LLHITIRVSGSSRPAAEEVLRRETEEAEKRKGERGGEGEGE